MIPGSTRFERPAAPGLGPAAHARLRPAVHRAAGAHRVRRARPAPRPTSSAVVLDARTGQVLALANGADVRPAQPRRRHPRAAGQPGGAAARSSPARSTRSSRWPAALEYGVATPDDVLRRAGQHQGRRPHRQRRLEPRHRALHADRGAGEVVQRRHDHDRAEGRRGALRRHARPVRARRAGPASGCPARAPGGCRRARRGRARRSATCRSGRACR